MRNRAIMISRGFLEHSFLDLDKYIIHRGHNWAINLRIKNSYFLSMDNQYL